MAKDTRIAEEESSYLDYLSTPLDVLFRTTETLGSVARSGIVNAAEGIDYIATGDTENRATDISDIFYGKKYQTIDKTYDDIANIFGGSYETTGSDWGEKIWKTGFELLGDIATDPITYMPIAGQASALSKVVKGLSATGKIGKLAAKGASKATPDIIKNAAPRLAAGIEREAAKSGTRAAVGGTAGLIYPVPEHENQFTGKLANMAKGAAITTLGTPVVKSIIPAVKFASNETTNMLVRNSHDDIAKKYGNEMSYSTAYDATNKAKSELAHVTRAIKTMNGELLDTHGAEGIEASIKILDEYVPEFVKERNAILANPAIKKSDIPKITRSLNDKYLEAIKKKGEYTPAMEGLVKRNKVITSMYNRESIKKTLKKMGSWTEKHETKKTNELFGEFYQTTGKEYRAMEGIDIHTPEILTKDAMEKLGKSGDVSTGFIKRTSEDAVETAGLTGKQRLNMEADRVIYSMMEKEDKRAARYLSELYNSEAKGIYGPLTTGLKHFDNLNNDMKAAMLTVSHSWLKNNTIENIYRTYIDSGVISATKVAGKQAEALVARLPLVKKFAQSAEMKDLIKVTESADSATDYIRGLEKNGTVKAANEFGAVGGNIYEDVLANGATATDKNLLIATKGKETTDELIKKVENRGILGKSKDFILDHARNIVGTTGSLIENTARLHTWKDYIKRTASKDQKKLLDSGIDWSDLGKEDAGIRMLFKNATEKVNDVFFDYRDLSIGEEKILKRFFPFYSFYSKNLNYWAETLSSQPVKAARATKLPARMVNYDPAESSHDKAGMSEYTRGLPHGRGENNSLKTISNLSVNDFIESVSSPASAVKSVKGKLGPLVNVPIDIISTLGKYTGALDEGPKSGIGQKILTSDYRSGKKRAGYGEKLLAQIDVATGGHFGTSRDMQGDLQLSNDIIPIAANIASLAPVPIVHAVSNAMERNDPIDELISPVKDRPQDIRREVKARRQTNKSYKFTKNEKRDAIKAKLQADILNNESNGTSRIREEQPVQQEATKVVNDVPMVDNNINPKEIVSNPFGLKISRDGLQKLLFDERPNGEPALRAGTRGSGNKLERFRDGTPKYVIGYEVTGTYPADLPATPKHRAIRRNDRIRANDEITKSEAIYLTAKYIKRAEGVMSSELKKAGIQLPQGVWNSVLSSLYNAGENSFKGFAKKRGTIAEWFMHQPATTNGIYRSDLAKRRKDEYDRAAEESNILTGKIIDNINSRTDISPEHKRRAIQKVQSKLGFPPYQYKGRR